jgi:quinohemoprotein ethanol dehydrogenase
MTLKRLQCGLPLFLATLMAACQGQDAPGPPSVASAVHAGAIDSARLASGAKDPSQWLTPGGDASGSYYSALTQINEHNVATLGFAWDYSLGTRRGLEATPVVVDGTLFTSGNWGIVYALDAATGRERWTYNPGVDGQWGRYSCCDVVNRGVAVWQGRVYVVSLDGYLHALDAQTGKRLWKVDTLPSREKNGFHYTSTGAPTIAGNLIVIGTAGADFKGARGSVAAFDGSTGTFRWRFFTVPRDPALGPQDQPHLQAAVATWDPHHDWSFGGGATVWDGISYDPQLHLIYIGTGNPAPYAVGRDAPSGDQLYAASIVAIHEQTGELAWYRQEVPGDGWDYDATQKMVLTDLDLEGQPHHVLMQAAKNGFLYVLDRATGDVLAANGFSHVNWTLGLDPKTHRPLRNPAADYTRRPRLVAPGAQGAHSWQPMSYSPSTGLVYIPAMDAPMVYFDTSHRPAGLIEGNFTVAAIWPEQYVPADLTSLFGPLPPLHDLAVEAGDKAPRSIGLLRAMDPKSGRIAWEQRGRDMWDGGVMSTAGNLVFRGDIAGQMNVYAADRGTLLKLVDVGTTIMAAPMTYAVNGEQYVAVMAGWGGGNEYLTFPEGSAARKYGNAGRIVAFKLGGGPVPKPAAVVDVPFADPPRREGSPAQIAAGEILYNRFCSRCHVFGRGMLPDLRRMTSATHQLFYDIVLNGAYQGKGMARWDDVLSRADAEAIHTYVVEQTWLAQPAAN